MFSYLSLLWPLEGRQVVGALTASVRSQGFEGLQLLNLFHGPGGIQSHTFLDPVQPGVLSAPLALLLASWVVLPESGVGGKNLTTTTPDCSEQ